MTKIESRDGDHWCTTEDVRDKTEVKRKSSPPDFEQAISEATDSVQAWYKSETGSTDLPDASNLHDLLVSATAWLAVSQSSFRFGHNFSGEGGQSNRVTTAEDKAESKFEEWAAQHDVGESEAATEGSATDVQARSGSLVDEF